jgi:hypothetical protein
VYGVEGTARAAPSTRQFHLIHDTSQQQYWLTIPEAVSKVICSDDGRRNRPKPVQQTRNKEIKNSYILLVVIYNYTSDARTHEHQIWSINVSAVSVYFNKHRASDVKWF